MKCSISPAGHDLHPQATICEVENPTAVTLHDKKFSLKVPKFLDSVTLETALSLQNHGRSTTRTHIKIYIPDYQSFQLGYSAKSRNQLYFTIKLHDRL